MKRFPAKPLFAAVFLLLAHSSALAARHALLIGNDNYLEVSKLKNAGADADAMASALRGASYEVTIIKNRDLRQMKTDIRQFKAKIRGGDEVVFFYSGHGVQIGATNYLLPVDLRSDSEDQVKDDALALSKVLEDLREQKPALVLAIIDACRDNPFKGQGRAIGGRGLTGVSGATGQMVIYSAGEGQQALDRLSDTDPVRNGVFTRVFVKEMERPGLTIDQIARNVREQVNKLARSRNHDQVPAIYDQVLGQFYFFAGSAPAVASAVAPAVAADGNIELAYWQSVKDTRSAVELGSYLKRYPQGQFSELASARLLEVAGGGGQTTLPILLAAAERDDVTSMFRAGRWYENGHNVPADKQSALKWYRKAAATGHPGAMAAVAAFALNGWSEDKDLNTARSLGEQAAAAGNERGMLVLHSLHARGVAGFQKDQRAALEWLKRAAELGERRAQYILAFYSFAGNNAALPKNPEQAARMIRLALAAGDDGQEKSTAPDALGLLGMMHREGCGDIAKDGQKAREYFQRSVDAGSAYGMFGMGTLYASGIHGVARDDQVAYKWFSQAAAGGNTTAMINIGYFHETGTAGLQRDLLQARQWYQKALAAGDDKAALHLKRVGN